MSAPAGAHHFCIRQADGSITQHYGMPPAGYMPVQASPPAGARFAAPLAMPAQTVIRSAMPAGVPMSMPAPTVIRSAMPAGVPMSMPAPTVIRSAMPAGYGTVIQTASGGFRAAPAAAPPAASPNDQLSPIDQIWAQYEDKMLAQGLNDAAIAAFRYNFEVLASGQNTMIPESAIRPVESLPDYDLLDIQPDPSLLAGTVVVKLNGGLGTGMGLDKAKSLLPVTQGNSFLDLIAHQCASMKEMFQTDVKFMLMNSFSTSEDTLDALSKYPELGTGADLEFVQNMAPKVTESDLTPASWPENPANEWCPPGHGDLYPAMLGSGTLQNLLTQGYKYMFVSNSDNLGATMDLKLLTYFAQTGAPFMMEVATRTDADKKGGHLAEDAATGGLLLRETAQCPDEDEKEFQNVDKYKFFNTNNLWVDLEALADAFNQSGGALQLPVMKNSKTVDPRDKKSTKVIQLETAMGAAISCFEGATAVVIPRSRFAPVKTTNDLFSLRSDAYTLTQDFRIELAASRNGVPPTIKLDGMYKFVDAMDSMIPDGPPSLIDCTKLVVEGTVVFSPGVVIKGEVTIKNESGTSQMVPPGVYENTTFSC